MKCKNEYEQEYSNLGFQKILGLDEAGRGPIAGELVVAGVCFPNGYEHEVIYDSKSLSPKKRESLFDEICRDASFFCIEVVSLEDIDQRNIYQATKHAMIKITQSFEGCEVALSDAMPFEMESVKVVPIIKGDQKSVSIAAASILAKVTRDRIMDVYDKEYPEYGFAKHKGYPTKQHKMALEQHGVLPIHRKTYEPIRKLLEAKGKKE